MFEGQEGPALDSGAPGSIGRKENRGSMDAGGLPAAGRVARVRPRMTGWSRPRKALAIGSVIGGVGLIAFGMATSSTQDLTALANIPVTTYADRDDSVPAGEYGVVDRPDAKQETAPESSTDTRKTDDKKGAESSPPTTGTDGPSSPTTPTDPTSPTTPPTAPPTTPTTPPTTPPTDPVPPTTPVQPKPLAFAGAERTYLLDLLGIKVLGGYTLTVTGNPGSTASVQYGASNAGTITFGSDGRGSISVGRSLLDLGLSNPVIRVAYSDGTAGAAIEGRRDSL